MLNRLHSSRTDATPVAAGTAKCAHFAASTTSSTRDFLLLTANVEVLRHPLVAGLAAQLNASPAQIVFAFARQVGMLPLTGTSSAEHMKQDLASRSLKLPPDAVNAIDQSLGS